jgi:formiminotetrahydrofolate cyclodeaminase
MPKSTPEEKSARSEAIQQAMVSAAEVPLRNAGCCRQVIELCRKLEESYNKNAASDLECARHLAEAGLKGCAANVRINLPSIKDENVRAQIGERLARIES